MLSEQRVVEIFRETGVMLEGHFLLTSGRHSDRYMQCARLFEYPEYSALLCADLAARFLGRQIDVVAGPALGGIIMSYEVSRALGCRNVFAERDNGKMTFRRGFHVPAGARVLVVEDVITTGGSVKEVIELVKAAGAEVAGVGVIVDRSGGRVDFGCRLESIFQTVMFSFEAGECPICKTGLPLIKPGSRAAKQL